MGKGPYEEVKSDGKRSFRVPRASDSLEEKKEPNHSEKEEEKERAVSFDDPTEMIATDIFEQFPSQFEGGYNEKDIKPLLKDLVNPSKKEERSEEIKEDQKMPEPLPPKKIPGVSPYIAPPKSNAANTQALLSRFKEVMKDTGDITSSQQIKFPGEEYIYDYEEDEEYEDEYEEELGFWERFREKRAQKKEEKRLKKLEKYGDYEEDEEYDYEDEYYDEEENVEEEFLQEKILDYENIKERASKKEESITFEIDSQKKPPLLSSKIFNKHENSIEIEDFEENVSSSFADQTNTGNIRRIHAKNGVDEETPLHPESLIIERSDDYRSAKQKKEKAAELDRAFSKYTVKTFLLFLTAIFFLYVNLSSYYAIPIPAFLDPLVEPFHFLVMNLVLIGLTLIWSAGPFKESIKGFFILMPDKSSLLSIATVFSIFQILFYLGQPNQILADGVHLYAPVIAVGWLFHMVGHMLDAARIRMNFGIVSSDKIKYRITDLPSSPFVDSAIHLTSNPDTQVMAPVESAFLQRYLELSDPEGDVEIEGADRWLPYICFGAAVVVSFFAWLILSSFSTAFTLFVGVLTISATFTAVFQNAYPQYRMSRFLAPKGAFVSNIETLEHCAETSSAIIDASNLFPKGSVVLQGLRTFEGGRIDEAIVDAASVMNAMGGTLADLFFSIIEYRRELLNPVESILYEEGRGIVAWSEGRRVLIGNRQLMRQYGIDAPSNDYESKYRAGGRDLIYLASSGVLTAMYVVLYKGERKVQEALEKITSDKVTLLLRSVDPNITAEKVIELFDLPDESVILLSDKEVRELDSVTSPQIRSDADTGFTDRFLGYLGVITTSIRFYTTLTITRLIERISILFGIIMLVSAAFFSQMVGITPFLLVIYNCAWLLLIWLMNKFRKI